MAEKLGVQLIGHRAFFLNLRFAFSIFFFKQFWLDRFDLSSYEKMGPSARK